MTIDSEEELRKAVWEAVRETPVFDMHTHLYDARFGDLLLRGIDDLLTYHYLVAEVFRYGQLAPKEFFNAPRRRQADIIWQRLFLDGSPLSESTRGVLTALKLLGQDTACRDLDRYRAHFEGMSAADAIDAVFHAAGVEAVVMTNDPFDEAEKRVWERAEAGDPRFRTALRVDGFLTDWSGTLDRLRNWGYEVKTPPDKSSIAEIRRFLSQWIDKLAPVYLAMSLGPSFDPFDGGDADVFLHKCIIPACRAAKLPVAMMIGVRRGVNPALDLAGDSCGKASIEPIEKLCAAYPDVRFLVTLLSRENQHELCVAARKFANLMPFGCWWFLNDPMTIDEITRMRVELLGTSFIPQHSDARILEQLVYKWEHSRTLIARVLAEKYGDLHETGWRVSRDEIRRDVANLFGGNFKRFVGT